MSSAERMISTYDSEKETFEVTVSVLGIIQQFSLNVPIDVASQFKADFRPYHYLLAASGVF